jgi:SAM-dependent methyltransferase
MANNEITKQSWNNWSDDWFKNGAVIESLNAIKSDPSKAFPVEVYEMIRNVYPNLENKKILVASSGDNIAAFGFHLLGATVTSTDIAEKQLGNAEKIAQENNWNMQFICTDSMLLDKISDDSYDMVYTSNGAHVWINNLSTMYKNFYRVLYNGGHYIFFETHPIIRPFNDSGVEVKIIKPYELTELAHAPDEAPRYAWRIGDFLRSLINAGFIIRDYRDIKGRSTAIMAHNMFYKTTEDLEKDKASKFDWLKNPWAALPQWMGCSVQKYNANKE